MPKTKDLPLLLSATGAETAVVVNVDGDTGRMPFDTMLSGATGQQISLQSQINALTARLVALESAGGPSSPSISTAVTISDTTPNVGDTLTASGGTPAGGSGTYTTFWQWYTVRVLEGPQPIPGATTSSLPVLSSMLGAQIFVEKWVIDSNGLPSVPKPSALTTAVGGTQSQSIALTNLPGNGAQGSTTTSTSASIGWTLSPAGGTVFARRDSFAPAAAANPFVLGAVTPLALGPHRVDFYVSANGTGSDINPAVPLVSYSWTILAAVTVTLSGLPVDGTQSTSAAIDWVLNPSNSGYVIYKLDGAFQRLATHPINLSGLAVGSHTINFYVTTDPNWDTVGFVLPAVTATHTWSVAASNSATPLESLPYPCPTNMQNSTVSGGSPDYNDGDTLLGADGVVRLNRVPDPLGSGALVYTHRVTKADLIASGGPVRSEKLWIDFTSPRKYMDPGNDYWMAFAVNPISSQWFNASNEPFLYFQTHSETPAFSYPDISIVEGLTTTVVKRSWSTTLNGAQEGEVAVGSFGVTVPGQWTRFIIHYRPGFNTGHAPKLEVWRKAGARSNLWTLVASAVATTDFNTYNTNAGSTYARIGLYFVESSTYFLTSQLACYLTTLYWGAGADLFDEADAAILV